MKPWMKFLMWFGLGAALGLSAGHQIGYNKAKHEDEQIVNDAFEQGRQHAFNITPTILYPDELRMTNEDTQKIVEDLRRIYGAGSHEEQYVDPPQPATDVVCCEHDLPDEEEDAEMPMDEPVIPEPENEGNDKLAGARAKCASVDEYAGDIIHGRKMSDIESASALFDNPPEIPVGDIPQFHPTYEIPRIVTEEEYDSYGDLDEKVLIYYEGDDVLYCVEDQKPIGEDEQPCLIGIGTLQGFRVGPGEPKDELFVVNETYGRFKILRMDDAFADAVDGTCAPDDDDDFWNDGDG